MTIFKFKRKRLSEEYYDKVSEESKKERLRYYKRKEKAGRPKKYSEEEKKEKAKNFYKQESKEISTPAIPLGEMLRMITKVGEDKVANDLGFPVYFIGSWKLFLKGDLVNGWKPAGKMMIQLQEYFGKLKQTGTIHSD
jgi:hypothetical protein